MKRIISGVIGAIVGLLVSMSYNYFFLQLLHWPTSASFLGASILGIFLLVLYEVIYSNYSFSPISKVCGAWKIYVKGLDDRPTSICQIILSKNKFIYKGYGITSNNEVGAEWISKDVNYDEENDELSFTAEATIIGTGKRYHNYGYIKFYKKLSGEYFQGNGYFIDMADIVDQHYMHLEKTTYEEFDKIVEEIHKNMKKASAS